MPALLMRQIIVDDNRTLIRLNPLESEIQTSDAEFWVRMAFGRIRLGSAFSPEFWFIPDLKDSEIEKCQFELKSINFETSEISIINTVNGSQILKTVLHHD